MAAIRSIEARRRSVLFILLVFLLGACTSQADSPSAPSPTSTQKPEPTPSPASTALPMLAYLSDGDTVYDDPSGRYIFHLVSDDTFLEIR